MGMLLARHRSAHIAPTEPVEVVVEPPTNPVEVVVEPTPEPTPKPDTAPPTKVKAEEK